MTMRTLILILLLCTVTQIAMAQQDPMFTHYRYNTQAINPAYAGSRKALTVTALNRSQWIGFEGAPMSQTLTLHAPFFHERAGFGVGLTHDGIAKQSFTGFQADFAFRIPVGKHSTLALGLKGALTRFSTRTAELLIEEEDDIAVDENFQGSFLPNFGTGLYFQQERFFLGLSVPALLKNHYDIRTYQDQTAQVEGGVTMLRKRTYYLISGTVFKLHDYLDFKPTTFLKYQAGLPLQLDLTAQFVYKDALFGGLTYRTNESVGMMIGFNFTEQLAAGYSFDYSTGVRTGNLNGGSHELMLRYDFYFNHSKGAFSPRHF